MRLAMPAGGNHAAAGGATLDRMAAPASELPQQQTSALAIAAQRGQHRIRLATGAQCDAQCERR
jgi:hypothetical protein